VYNRCLLWTLSNVAVLLGCSPHSQISAINLMYNVHIIETDNGKNHENKSCNEPDLSFNYQLQPIKL